MKEQHFNAFSFMLKEKAAEYYYNQIASIELHLRMGMDHEIYTSRNIQ